MLNTQREREIVKFVTSCLPGCPCRGDTWRYKVKRCFALFFLTINNLFIFSLSLFIGTNREGFRKNIERFPLI